MRENSGRLITDLTRDDFQIVVDRTPAEIRLFAKERSPLTVAVLLATPQTGTIDRIRSVGFALVDALEPTERATIGTYSDEVSQSPILTSDHRTLQRILSEELWMGMGGAATRGVDLAIRALGPAAGKRAVIVVGSDFSNFCAKPVCPSESEVARLAETSEVLVYGIHIPANPVLPLPERANPPGTIRRIASRIGGGYLRLEDEDDVETASAAVLEQLRHEYVIGFAPLSTGGRDHTVSVRLRRSGLTARILRAGGGAN